MFSQEYVAALVIVLGGVLKLFKIEIDNGTIEGVIAGILGLWIAVRRYQRKDITIVGKKK